MPMPTLLRDSEKEASTLHLYRPGDGLLHFEFSRGLATGCRTVFAIWAFVQLVSRVEALSQTDWQVSVMSFQTLLFMCFQMLHINSLNMGCWLLSSRRNILNILWEMSSGVIRAFETVFQIPKRCQHCELFVHKNKACKLSSCLSQKGHCEVQLTPRARRRTFVGKHPRATLYKKFLIRGGVLERQSPTIRFWWVLRSLSIMSLYALWTE